MVGQVGESARAVVVGNVLHKSRSNGIEVLGANWADIAHNVIVKPENAGIHIARAAKHALMRNNVIQDAMVNVWDGLVD